MKKAFGYLRVSGKGQIGGDGFRRQAEEIAAYAKANGYEIAQVFREEGVSGVTDETERPAFQAMLAAILGNGVRTIIIEGMDRLARSVSIQEQLVLYIAAKGIELISARTGENVTEAFLADPMRRALVQIQGVFAELEKGLLVKKLRAARETARKAKGKCEGRKSIRETAPEVLAEIKRLRRTKPGQKQPTWEAVADALNARGIKTASGKNWTATNAQVAWHRNG